MLNISKIEIKGYWTGKKGEVSATLDAVIGFMPFTFDDVKFDITDIVELFRELYNDIKDVVSDTIGEAVDDAVDDIGRGIGEVAQNLEHVLGDIGNRVKDVVQEVGRESTTCWETFREVLTMSHRVWTTLRKILATRLVISLGFNPRS